MIRPARVAMVLAALAVTAAPAAGQTATPSVRQEILRQFDASMRKFEALARAMPDSAYRWSPGEGVMPVARVFAHVARYNYYYPAEGLGAPPPAGVDVATMEAITDKARIVELLARSGEHVRTLASQGSDADWAAPTRLYNRDLARWGVLLQLVTHMNEHLGQSIAYARMNGVVPPWSQ
jgi:uncharacterized damage-inducible protein DinB